VHTDFLTSLELPLLDGTLLANALHYVPTADQLAVLARIVDGLAPNGRLVVVDYDGRTPNQWVPFPVSIAHLREMGAHLELTPFTVVGTRPSAYGGTMYAAYAIRRGESAPAAVPGQAPVPDTRDPIAKTRAGTSIEH
jgi:hypothetical protein